MPLQNRVTPSGAIIATTARGTLMGNRGCLHDGAQRIRRPYQLKRWIICVLRFKDRHRLVMTPGRYTELFFLDEATALAAGHRPCAECQRERYRHFRDHWAAANPDLTATARPAAVDLDSILHRERIDDARAKLTYPAPLAGLPDGAFIGGESADAAYLVQGDLLFPWTPFGYGQPLARPKGVDVQVLTPRSVVNTLIHGYQPALHLSAAEQKE